MPKTNQKQEGGLKTRGLSKHPGEKTPLVSVITIVYNNVNHIEKTIQSVLSQSYELIEYIIIDGGSTDGTIDIIRKYDNQIDYWVSEPDEGIADAMNKGILLATGTLINHLNAGDSFASPDVVSFVAESYLTQSWRWCYGNGQVIDEQEQVLGEFNPIEFNQIYLLVKNFIPHQTVFIEKSLLAQLGLFDTNFKIAMDYHMWLRVQRISEPILQNKIIIKYLYGGVSSDLKKYHFECFKARSSVARKFSLIRVVNFLILVFSLLQYKIRIKGTFMFVHKYFLLRVFNNTRSKKSSGKIISE